MAEAADHVGLVGLGFIGRPIGERLIATGRPPVVYDVVSDKVAALVASGAEAAGSVGELAARCGVVLVCVQTDEQCIAVVEGEEGVLASAREGAVVAVLSTISPRTIERLAASAAATGVALLEVPMAGQGARSVADGSMFVLAGGSDEARERARPTLERFARVVDTGPIGSGAALKLAHNVLVYVSRMAALEAVELARAAGVRDGLVAELTSRTGGLCEQSSVWLDIYEARLRGDPDAVSDHDMEVASDLLGKDLRHAVALGAEKGIALPASALTAREGDRIYVVRRDR